jgi:hypothetical protein
MSLKKCFLHITLIASLLISTALKATELCSEWPRKIEPEMQMQEGDFTLENYQEATKYLKEKHEGFLHTFAKSNREKVIKGYLLKTKALESKSNSDIFLFCSFLIDEAFYSD